MLFGEAHRDRDGFMGVAEWHALFHQIVGQVGGGGITLQGSIAHRFRIDPDAGDHLGVDAQCLCQCFHGIEQRFLVFLIVLVVSQGLALHQCQQRDQVSVHPPGLAAHQFRDIGILFLGHDGRTCAKAIGDFDKTEARTHPQNQFFRKTRQMGHDQRGASGEFDREVAIGNRIQRIFAHSFKAEQLGDIFAFDRIAGSGQCCRAQRQAIDTLAAITQTFRIALEHLKIGHQVMCEADRLGDLQVREAGHDRVDMRFGKIEQCVLQRLDQYDKFVDRMAQIQAYVGRNLVIAGTTGVQPFAGIADQCDEPSFDVQVHIFQIGRPDEFTADDLVFDLGQTALDLIQVSLCNDAACSQHLRMCQRALDIEHGQPVVKPDRRGVALHQLGHRFGETP